MKTIFNLLITLFLGISAFAQTTYDVGPTYPKTKLSQVPWSSLGAGDVVNIHYDVNPYKEKFLISTSGTLANPIKIIGIAGPNGEKPIIDGNQANAISGQLCFTATQPYGLIFIEPAAGGTCNAYGPIPHDIIIDGLEIKNAHQNFTYSLDGGSQVNYNIFSCGIYAERVQNLTVRNCNFNHCGIGLYINSKYGTHALSKNILVEKNYFTQNGVIGDGHEHNSYIEAESVVYQYNFYDHLVWGSYGASIKDRSAGNIFRYNWIYASDGHAIEIAEAQGGSGYLDLLPSYKETFIYGNVIYNGIIGAVRIIRYGGDQGDYTHYRQGTLYFYNNTVVDEGDKSGTANPRWETALFLLPDKGEVGNITIVEKVDCRNNVIYNQAATIGKTPTTFCLMSTDLTGTVNMTNNWLSPGIVDFKIYFQSPNTGTVTHVNSIFGNNGQNTPNFNDYPNQDYSLSPLSNAVNQGTSLLPAAANYPVLEEYVKHFSSKLRNTVGLIDLGAYENALVLPVPVTGITLSPTTLNLGMGQAAQLTATVLPVNANNKTITWTSSNATIVYVSPSGQIYGLNGGLATITATTNDGGFTATCQVQVKQTVVAWDFKNKSQTTTTGIAANLTKQIAREASFAGVYDFNTTGAINASDFCLSSPNWDNGANLAYWLINFTTTGYNNLKFSSLQRAGSTGPRDFMVQYRIGNAGTWTDLSVVTVATDWTTGTVSNVVLPNVCNNQTNVKIRWLLTSNTAVNASPIIATGSGRIDEIVVTGDAIPPCPTTQTFSGVISAGKYDVATTILIQNAVPTQILSSTDVTLNAGNYVTLLPNFEAQTGSVFKIYNGGCGN